MAATRLTSEAIAECIRVLEAICADRGELAYLDLELRTRLLTAAGRVSRPERVEQRILSREVRRKDKRDTRAADRAVLAQAGIRKKRLEPVFVTPPRPELGLAGGGTFELGTGDANGQPNGPASALAEIPALNVPRSCYVCKQRCTRMHGFYDHMCDSCGDFNFAKRSQTADLRGRVALISGARVNHDSGSALPVKSQQRA